MCGFKLFLIVCMFYVVFISSSFPDHCCREEKVVGAANYLVIRYFGLWTNSFPTIAQLVERPTVVA